MSRYPDADPEDVRLTLISLQSPPFERLIRSLRRGRGFAANRPKDRRVIPILQNALRTLEVKTKRRTKKARSRK